MIEPIRIHDDDDASRAPTLRLVDDSQALIIELADLYRDLAVTLTLLQSNVTRDWFSDPERAHRRATARIIEANETLSRAEDTRERLARALRSAGRL